MTTRPCVRCHNDLPERLRQSAKYCSVQCRQAMSRNAWKARSPEVLRELERKRNERRKRTGARRNNKQQIYARTCVLCERAFTSPFIAARFCSHACANRNAARIKAARYGSLPPDEDVEVPVEVTYVYERKCLLCGRAQQDPEWLTRDRARLLQLVGLPPCFACRGAVFLEEVEAGHIGSPVLVTGGHLANAVAKWGAGVR